jgi:hypothetical protein
MFNIDIAIIEGIKNLAIFGGGFKEGLTILSGIIIYSISAVKVEGRNSK